MEQVDSDAHTQEIKLNKKRYPTRCQKIGEVNCLFVDWYKDGKIPIINVGPSKGPMVFLILFAGFCLGYLLFMITAIWPYQKLIGTMCFIPVTINLIVFFKCMLGDSGIKERIFHHYIKIVYESNDESALNTSDSFDI